MQCHRQIFVLLCALSAMPVCAQDPSAQDGTRVFTGSGASEAAACAAARADAQAWVKHGNAEGRRRELVGAADCACTPTDGRLTCRIDAQVRDQAYEEEEEER